MGKIEINADMGESFGRWKLGDDEGLMPYLDVCNIAAGFHASDPTTLHKSECSARYMLLAVDLPRVCG